MRIRYVANGAGWAPTPAESERFARFVTESAEAHNVRHDGVLGNSAVWRDVAHVMFNLQEFITIP